MYYDVDNANLEEIDPDSYDGNEDEIITFSDRRMVTEIQGGDDVRYFSKWLQDLGVDELEN